VRAYEVARLTLSELSVEGVVLLDSIRSGCDVNRLMCRTLLIENDVPTEAAGELRLTTVDVVDEIRVAAIQVAALTAVRLDCRDLDLRQPTAEAITLGDLRVRGSLNLQDPRPAHSALAVAVSGRCEDVQFTAAPHGGDITVTTDGLVVDGNLDVSGPAAVVLRNTSVRGELTRRPTAAGYQGALSIAEGTVVNAATVPDPPIRSVAAVQRLCRDLLGSDGVRELSILRQSLAGRPDEQDVAYYALRQAEALQAPPLLRAGLLLRGLLLGWGVRLRQPVLTLAGAVLFTAAVIHVDGFVRHGERILSGGAYGRALGLAAALWFNVGVGLPNELSGGGWTAASVVMSTAGLILITIIVGVALRRLVR
jgi:hypothetical protein